MFLEVGPGSSCTRLIDRILETRPHLARSACRPDRDALAAVLDVLADCIAHRIAGRPGSLYDTPGRAATRTPDRAVGNSDAQRHTVRVEVGLPAFQGPPPALTARCRQPLQQSRPWTSNGHRITTRFPTRSHPIVVSRSRSCRGDGRGCRRRPNGPRIVSDPRKRGAFDRSTTRKPHGSRPIAPSCAWPRARPTLIGRHLAFQLDLIEDWTKAGEDDRGLV